MEHVLYVNLGMNNGSASKRSISEVTLNEKFDVTEIYTYFVDSDGNIDGGRADHLTDLDPFQVAQLSEAISNYKKGA